MESEVILTILQRGQAGIYTIVGSDILELEMNRMHDPIKRQKVKDLYRVVKVSVGYAENIKERSQEIMKMSKIRTFDSLHIAAAENAKADIMLTTDDKLERMAERLKLKVRVMNPLKFAWEVI